MRVFQVALLPAYYNVSTPQTNLTASIPWSRPGPNSVLGLSAYCYYHSREVANTHPDIPLGVVVSAWGGTAIQPWMTPETVAQCSHLESAPAAHMRVRDVRPDSYARGGGERGGDGKSEGVGKGEARSTARCSAPSTHAYTWRPSALTVSTPG